MCLLCLWMSCIPEPLELGGLDSLGEVQFASFVAVLHSLTRFLLHVRDTRIGQTQVEY